MLISPCIKSSSDARDCYKRRRQQRAELLATARTDVRALLKELYGDAAMAAASG